MVKGIRLFLVVGILVLMALPLAIPQMAMAGSWSVHTIASEWYGDNNSVFWTVLRASVTISDATVTSYGFVWDTEPHSDPGNVPPWEAGYYGNTSTEDSRTSSFNYEYGPEQGSGPFILPYEVYYYRACAVSGGVWAYGDELMVTGQSALWLEGSWAPYGTARVEYLVVDMYDVLIGEPGIATLRATLVWHPIYGAFTTTVYDYGFVVSESSHANPSGWYLSYSDVAPGASDYEDYYEADEMAGQSTDFGFTKTLEGLDPEGTYYVRAVFDIPGGGDWMYGPEMEFDFCEEPELQPPYDLVAIPITGTEAFLSWWSDNPNTSPCDGTPKWPNLMTIVHMEEWEYPDDPPSTTDGSVVVYSAPEQYGETTYSVYGLTPGTSYYFRVWFYDPDTDNTTTYDEDFCTPYSGITPPSEVDIPDNWFLDPTCDSWDNVPMAMTIVNGIYDKLAIPTTTVCLWINLLLLSCAMTMSYSGVAAARQDMGGSTILVPFIVMCFGFIVGPFIGAFPGFFLAIGVIIGLGVAFAWARA